MTKSPNHPPTSNAHTCQSMHSQTPLHLAAKNNQLGAMEVLLTMGARPELRNAAGQAVLDLCVGEGSIDLVEQFEERRRQRQQERAGGAAAGGKGSRPGSGPVVAVGAAAAGGGGGTLAVTAAGTVSKAPEMPHFKRPKDLRFDSDGFPLPAAEPPAAEELRGLGVDDDERLAAYSGSEGEEEGEAQGAEAGQQGTADVEGGADAAADWQEAARQEVARHAAAGGGGRSSGPAGALSAPPAAAAGLQPRGGGSKARPVSGNKKFLNRYQLGNAGLFAPM